ncbi:hypothetical protein Hanom_Chr00s001006g01671281 [Helianthus anomalus]
MIVMLQAPMSSSESGLSDTHDPMPIVSDDEPFALPDFGDDILIADGVPVEDPFDIHAPVHDHLIIGHPDGEHIVASILDAVPLVVIPPKDWPFVDLFGDDVGLFLDGPPANAQGDGEIDDDVVVAAGLQPYATDYDDDTATSIAPLSPARVPTPPHDPEPVPEPYPVPFGQPDVAPLVPEPIHAPIDHPFFEPFIPPPSPADVAPPPPVESDVPRIDLPIVFLQEIPVPRLGEGTSGQPPSFDPFASAAFPPIPQTTSFTAFTSTSLDEPFRWFPPYTMPILDPYYPSHYGGYTRDELLLSLQLQFEILSRRVMELEVTPSYPPPCPCHSVSVPPHSSSSPFAYPPTAPV